MRIMGLDYGTKTVGVAVSDELLLTARAVEIIRRERSTHLRKTCARIEELIAVYGVTEIVVGLPLHMDMSESEMSLSARAFAQMLERRTALPVRMWDERLTSVEAEEIMRTLQIEKKDQKNYIDMVAAKVILESYLEKRQEEPHA